MMDITRNIKIEFVDDEILLVLETIAKTHMVEYMQGKDNSGLESLIRKIATALKESGKQEIFDKVFVPVGKK